MKNLLIDGKNLCFRSSVTDNSLTNPRGEPIGVVYTFLQILRKVVARLEPDKIFIFWDGSKSTWRQDLYSEYKEKQHPEDLNETQKAYYVSVQEQEDVLRNIVLPQLPITQVYVKGVEADDLICAAVSVLSKLSGQEVFIMSTDHDFYQLLDMASIVKDSSGGLFTREDFIKRFGFTPDKFTQYRALVGDSSDNIKGIMGIGKKTAEKILSKYNVSEFIEVENAPKELRQKKLLDEIDVFERNVKLIDLFQFPDSPKLMRHFIKAFNGSNPTFKQQKFKQYLMSNKMFSILGSFNKWKKPFINLGV